MKNKKLKKSDIIYHIVKRWRLILLFTVIGLAAGIIMSSISFIRGEMTKEYKINASFAVEALDKNGKFPSGGTPSKSDTDMAKDLTETAVYIVNSRRNVGSAIESLGLKRVSTKDIISNLTVEQVNDTSVIEITLLWSSEKEGIAIVKAITESTNESMQDIMKIGYVSMINKPKASFIIGGNFGGIPTWTLVGLLIGLMICIIQWLFEPTVINESEIETMFGVTTLGSVPFDAKYAMTKPMYHLETQIQDDIKSVTHLLMNHLKQIGAKRLYVTSAMHEEGKTRLIADIGLHLSHLGKKTLLIDCDMTNAALGSLFFEDLPYEQTLNALYRGDSDSLDAISHINGCLDVLPMILEDHPENMNDALLHVLDKVAQGYDYVLIDTAPVGVDAEVLRLNEIVDTVMFVVRFDKAKADTIRHALLRVTKSGITIVGATFNYVVNWKNTIFKTPKHVSNAIRRELRKRNKNRAKKEKQDKKAAERHK